MTWSIREETIMSGKLEACAECTQMCHVMHQTNGDPSCTTTSFFKIMFGADYNDFLFLPPKFACSVQYLIGQEAQLEDSSGEHWTVKVSNIEDSLAFDEGWSAFSRDHRLKLGEILVFHYIYPSRFFFVQIYGASGCPKYRRVEGNGNSNKRARTEGDFGAEDGACHMNDNEPGSNGSLGSGTFDINERQPASTSNTVDFDSDILRVPVVPETRQYEEPFCMIERDDGYIQGENRSCLYDLSKYETSVGAEKLSHRGSTILEFSTGTDMLINDSVNLSGDLLKSCIEKLADNGENSVAMPEEEGLCQKAEKPSTTHPTEADMLINDSVKPSRDLLNTCIEKSTENGQKIVAMTEEAACQKAERPSTTHPIGSEKSSHQDSAGGETSSHQDSAGGEKSSHQDAAGGEKSSHQDAAGGEKSSHHDSAGGEKSSHQDSAGGEKSSHQDSTGAEKSFHQDSAGGEKSSHQDSAGSEKSSHQEKTVLKSPMEGGMFDNESVNLSRHVMETFATKTAEIESRMKILQMPKNETGQNAKKESAAHLAETMKVTKKERAETDDMHVLKGMLHGTVEKGIKEGIHTFGQPIKDENLIHGAVKEEPVDYDDTPLHEDAVVGASCLVVIGSKDYLELPTDFPSIISVKHRADRRVIHLRGPDTKLWPVIYIQKLGMKIVQDGWKMFRKVNGIQPGDECLFQSENNKQEFIFKVNIVNGQINGTKALNSHRS